MAKRHRVGFALASKKVGSFLQPSLIDYAATRGLDLVTIDPSEPLSEQGPLDCLIHKFYDDDWKLQLQSFAARNPHSPIVDPVEAIEQLHNRVSMLQVVTNLKLNPQGTERLQIPRQVAVSNPDGWKASEGLIRELGFPIIAKPLLANGSILSHKMCLIFDRQGLEEVEGTPIVLQEFVNHGGVIFKVYVAGDHVQCVMRKSLPDISAERLKALKGSLPFAQVSNLADGGDGYGGSEFTGVELPPERFVKEVGLGLKEKMGLNLFNFDMIRDAGDNNRYLVIDINYFPGYAKMPNYESVLTDFILQLLQKNGESG